MLINQGCDALVLAERLGHEKVSTTLNTYSHLFPHKQQELVSNLEQLGAGTGNPSLPEPPARNILLETMGIAYDMDDASSDSADTTVSSLPYGPMPKEKTSGNIIPMPQRKVM